MTKILIVDDRPINREVLTALLADQGFEILEAEDGLDALDHIRKDHPNLIITDIAMPRMDGLSLVKTLLQDPLLSKIPVIFYSATYKAAEAYRLANAVNIKYVLTKPCDPEVIISTIKKALQSSSLEAIYLPSQSSALQNINLRLTNLIEISLDMSLEHNMQKLIFIMCKSSRQFLNASHVGIIMENSNHKEHYVNHYIDQSNEMAHYAFQLQHLSFHLQDIFLSKKNICLHSPIVDVEKIGLNNVFMPFSSLLCLPVRTVRAYYGKIYFINQLNHKFFTHSDQRFMMTLCDKFAIHYENLLLYQEVERHSQKLEAEITQRIQSEEKLRQYRERMAEVVKMNSLGEMASSLAHEINQPLAAIAAYVKGCIQRIKNKKEITEDILDILHETALQAERAGEVVHRIKHFVRKGELFYEKINVAQFFEETINIMKQEHPNIAIHIDCKISKDLNNMEIDKIQIQQVILNLLRNAREAMLDAKTMDPKIQIEADLLPSNRIKICIKDNGPGFSDKIADNLFDLYFTTKPQGMGLGLAISRSIIEAHLGHLKANSLVDGGCIFQFDLPIRSARNNPKQVREIADFQTL